jgi:hypothetical protein
MTSDDDLLTTGQVAALLGVSTDTVRRAPRLDLPYRTTSTGSRPQRRYRRADVETYRRRLNPEPE